MSWISSNKISGMGTVAMWGLTPATDLLKIIHAQKRENILSGRKKEAVNILLIGQCDARHILKTLENYVLSRTSESKENEQDVHINFYMVENCLELYARQILLIAIACQPIGTLGIHAKTIQFMEIYGNILFRPQTKRYLRMLSEQLMKFVTDEICTGEVMHCLKLDQLKFRERDSIVDIFKYWRDFSDPKKVDMNSQWDSRLRHYLGTRYDSRRAVFDWDYNMKLIEKDKNAKIITPQEYKNWRITGLAFSELDSDYSQPNVTLNSGLKGKQFVYSGDTITGPFVSYGIQSENKSLFETCNDQFKNKSYDVTYSNVENICKVLSSVEKNGQNYEFSIMENVSLHFLPINACENLKKKSKYIEFFDMAYFASNMAHSLTPSAAVLLKQDAVVIVEKARYALEFRPEHNVLYDNKVCELAKQCGLITTTEEFIADTYDDKEFCLNYLQFNFEQPGQSVATVVPLGSDSDIPTDWDPIVDGVSSTLKIVDDTKNICVKDSLGDGDCVKVGEVEQ